MDPKRLSPPAGITLLQVRDWARGFRRMMDYGLSDDRLMPSILRSTPKSLHAEDNNRLAQIFHTWLIDNRLLEKGEDGLWHLTADGLQLNAASGSKRIKAERAWEHIERLLARVRWINQAPVEKAPGQVDTLYLFGSLQDPGKPGYGDADLAMDMSWKTEQAYDRADAWFREANFFFPTSPHGPRFHTISKKTLKNGQSFLSLCGETDLVFRTLLKVDPSFSACALIPGAEAHTTPAINTALANAAGKSGMDRTHDRIAEIRKRVDGFSSLELAVNAIAPVFARVGKRWVSNSGMLTADVERAMWWASLGPDGHYAALLCAQQLNVIPEMMAAAQTMADDMQPGAVQREWSGGWNNALARMNQRQTSTAASPTAASDTRTPPAPKTRTVAMQA